MAGAPAMALRLVESNGQSYLQPSRASAPQSPAEETAAAIEKCGPVGLDPSVIKHADGVYSLWHDIRLRSASQGTYSFVVEIPKGELTKWEVSAIEANNPVTENEKATKKLNKFAKPPPFNYGIIPQTYCDPDDKSELGVGGDAAPLDCAELGGRPLQSGESHEVEVLGAFCVLDKGELDWKIIAISKDSLGAMTAALGTLGVYAHLHNEMLGMLKWFQEWYKFKGVAGNPFPYGMEIMPRSVAIVRIYRAHLGWQRLLASEGNSCWTSALAVRRFQCKPAIKRSRT